MLSISRIGIARTTKQSTNQCKSMAWNKYNYHIRIDVADGVVTKPSNDLKFIIEQTLIDKRIKEIFETKMSSCEEMALIVRNELVKLCREHTFTPIAVYVRIRPRLKKGLSPAWIECTI
jgi:hypothetical protein